MPSVFISYSHTDEVWKDRLAKHLGVLEKQGLLDSWDDRRIEAGEDWFEEIEAAIEDADVAVLLVSADFLTSKFILEEEIPRLLQRRTKSGLKVFPVVVRPCLWKEVGWLSRFLVRPKDGKPLLEFGEQWETALVEVAAEVYRVSGGDPGQRDLHKNRNDFLGRVEAVCRLREGSAKIERIRRSRTFGTYLRVSKSLGGIADVYPVGAVEHGLSRDAFQAFLQAVDGYYRKDDPGLISFLVYGGEPAPEDLVKEAAKKRVRLMSLIEFQGLIDFRPYVEQQTRKLALDPVYPPHLYVPQRVQFQQSEIPEALAQVQEWLSSPNGRFVVLLGDFGTGKTFLLHELARQMGEQGSGLIPILLQMRSLEKGRSLDALLAQHFAQEGVEDFSPSRFRYMLEQGRIALLFDGFDELALRVTFDRATEHFDTLLQAATGNAKVVVTSRRQHFLSDEQVKTVLAERAESVPGHRLAVLQTFNREQILTFLENFCGDKASAAKRMQLIDRVKDLLGLSHNPRLLGFIAELPEEQLLEAESGEGEITAARLYELLLQRWLEGEFERVHPKGAPPGLSVEDRWRGVTALALRLWQKTEASAGLAELTEGAARVIEALRQASLDPAVAAFQLGSGTLLVRDEEGNFSFLHQSILEYLVARHAAGEIEEGKQSEALGARQVSPLMADFLGSLAGRDTVVAWARRALAGDATEAAKNNALLVLQRLKEEARLPAALARDLRGKDLSYQDLTGTDLSGADLTGARLLETRLESADLSNAVLADADLSGAVLSAANLSGTNFTGARLLGADLRGAHLRGTVLRRAKLLAAQFLHDALQGCDTFGAAFDPSLTTLVGFSGSARAVAWNGGLVASAEGSLVRLWEVDTGREIRRFQGHNNGVSSVAFSPDGKALASASYDNTVRLWKVDTGREIRRFKGHDNEVWSVAFSPDGKALASASSDKTVRLWEVDTGNEIRRFKGHDDGVSSVTFNPDGKALASGSYDKTVRLWEVDTGSEIQRFKGHDDGVRSVAFSPDGKSLASASSDKTVRLWEVDTGSEIRRFKGHDNGVRSVAFSPDGKALASGSDDEIVRLWEVDTGREIRRFQGHGNWVWSVAFSPDGKALSSASSDNTVRLWEVDTGREIRRFKGHDNWAWSVAFSPDGKSLASASSDNIVRLWEVDTGREIRRFKGHHNRVLSVAFSPDGKSLASGSYDNTVRLWEADSGREIRRFQGHHNRVLGVAFSTDGKSLASAASDNTVRLWEVDTGREIRRFQGHHNRVLSVAFSPDGKSLASGSDDNTVRLWRIDTGDGLAVLGLLSEGWVALTPDGRYKLGGIPAGSFWHVINLCRFEAGELDDWIPGLRLRDDASLFDLPPWTPEVRRPKSLRRANL